MELTDGNIATAACHSMEKNGSDNKTDKDNARDKWSRQIECVLTCIGFTVGFGNILRFPYLCMANGGGVFLIPYFIFIITCGIPLYFLELSLGQFSSATPLLLWQMCPLFKGVGWAMIIISVINATYSMNIFAYVIFYLVMSCRRVLPWTTCNNYWNSMHCYSSNSQQNITIANSTNASYNQSTAQITDRRHSSTEEFFSNRLLDISDGIEHMGTIKLDLVMSLMAAWSLIFLCLCRGIKSSSKVVYVSVLAPYLLLSMLLVRGVTLQGSFEGIKYYIIPDIGKLADINVWTDACLQVFFSLGTGWGSLLTFASYSKFHNNCLRDAVFVCIACGGTSFFAGFVVFSVLGHLAYQSGLPIKDVVTQGPGLAFIAYPEAISHIPLAPFWAVCFFLMLATVALDSFFGAVETVISGLVDEFPGYLRKRRLLFVITSVLIMFLMGLVFMTRGGIYIFQIIDWYACTFTMMVIVLFECIVVAYIYGIGRFYADLTLMMKRRPSKIWVVLWCVTTPILLFTMLTMSAIRMTPPRYGDYVYPQWAVLFGWLMAMIAISAIPIVAIFKIVKTNGSFSERVKMLLLPTDDWGPTDPRYSVKYRAQHNIRPSWRERMNISRRPDADDLMNLQEQAVSLTVQKDEINV